MLKLGDHMKNFFRKYNVLLYNPILVYFFLLFGISLIAIASSYPLSQSQYQNTNFVTRQLIFYGASSVIMLMVMFMGISRIRALRWWIYGAFMMLLLGIFIDAHLGINVPFVHAAKGATRWYRFGSFSFQPSEFMRIALILVVADIIQTHNEKYSYAKRTSKNDLILILKVIGIIVPPCYLIYRQPDSGITILIIVTTAAMLLGAGIQWRFILSVGGFAALFTTLFISLVRYYPEFLLDVVGIEPYQLSRFNGWFDPFGAISGDGWQLANGLSAMGSGGLFGNGFQSGLTYFPESHTDFIFPVIGKDFGLFGALAVIIIYALFNIEILNTAALNRGKYNSFVCVGIFASLIGQQFWNIGMSLGLIPISGVTLPFISHGGSSVLASMILLGIILSCFVEGAKIKHSDVNYQEHILYLKTKSYLKEDPKGIQKRLSR